MNWNTLDDTHMDLSIWRWISYTDARRTLLGRTHTHEHTLAFFPSLRCWCCFVCIPVAGSLSRSLFLYAWNSVLLNYRRLSRISYDVYRRRSLTLECVRWWSGENPKFSYFTYEDAGCFRNDDYDENDDDAVNIWFIDDHLFAHTCVLYLFSLVSAFCFIYFYYFFSSPSSSLLVCRFCCCCCRWWSMVVASYSNFTVQMNGAATANDTLSHTHIQSHTASKLPEYFILVVFNGFRWMMLWRCDDGIAFHFTSLIINFY